MTERAQIWQLMRKNLVEPDWQRIENQVGTGAPDVNGVYKGVEAWVELKCFHSRRLLFEPSQTTWIPRRLAAGGRVFILARKERTFFLFHGIAIRLAVMNAKGDKASADLLDFPTLFKTSMPFDWKGLQAAIFEVPFPKMVGV